MQVPHNDEAQRPDDSGAAAVGRSAAAQGWAADHSLDRIPRATGPRDARHPTERSAHKTQDYNLSTLVAPSERSGLFQGDAVRQRISMPMHELPFGPFTAIDLCDPQRPVLLW